MMSQEAVSSLSQRTDDSPSSILLSSTLAACSASSGFSGPDVALGNPGYGNQPAAAGIGLIFFLLALLISSLGASVRDATSLAPLEPVCVSQACGEAAPEAEQASVYQGVRRLRTQTHPAWTVD